MKAVYLVAVFSLTYLAAANDRDCRLECFHAAVSYRNLKKENMAEADMENRMMEECERYAEKLYYPCSKAVPLILKNDDIRGTIEAWDIDSASDPVTEKAVKKYCWTACRNRREE
ncbi:hypothetical protein ANCCAN_03241 [Ancylostoma caninum]|uniref:Saposin B-type domain-containing protein n=1 Tax=Ancylostoma caninum TaxID=29170 RepID=A0A368H4D3_ANCCA|nr:hypothetical protein ANCCAN_03241 [Ancylostoma caninum]